MFSVNHLQTLERVAFNSVQQAAFISTEQNTSLMKLAKYICVNPFKMWKIVDLISCHIKYGVCSD